METLKYRKSPSDPWTELVGLKGDKGDVGDSGVFIGPEPPTDPNYTVWINTSTSSHLIDTTLTQADTPAEAKAVGDKLKTKINFSTNGEVGQFAISDGQGGITWLAQAPSEIEWGEF